MMIYRVCLFIVLTVVVGTGCGKAKGPLVFHPVSGEVIYGGKPAEGVQVFLVPTSAPMVPDIPTNPHGVTGPDGKFKLTTVTEGDGAAEGGYQVVLIWPEKKPEDEESDSDRLLTWYDAAHSTLTAQIKAGTNQLPPFNLPVKTKPPEAMQGIPGRN